MVTEAARVSPYKRAEQMNRIRQDFRPAALGVNGHASRSERNEQNRLSKVIAEAVYSNSPISRNLREPEGIHDEPLPYFSPAQRALSQVAQSIFWHKLFSDKVHSLNGDIPEVSVPDILGAVKAGFTAARDSFLQAMKTLTEKEGEGDSGATQALDSLVHEWEQGQADSGLNLSNSSIVLSGSSIVQGSNPTV